MKKLEMRFRPPCGYQRSICPSCFHKILSAKAFLIEEIELVNVDQFFLS